MTSVSAKPPSSSIIARLRAVSRPGKRILVMDGMNADNRASAARGFHARRDDLNPTAALRAALRAMLGGKSRRRAVGIAIGVQQHLIVGALDGAIAGGAIAAEDAETGVARGAARAGRTRRPALARWRDQALHLGLRQSPLHRHTGR